MKKTLRDVCQMLVVASALIVPAIGRADDVPFNELSAQWWQWVLSVPTSDNPLQDQTGDKCMVGQRGSIWFLTGTFGGTASRRCSVPEGTTLFFPIVNQAQVNTPGVCGQVGPLSVAQMRANVAPLIDGITTKSATVDGVAVRGIQRVRSVPFVTALPVDNIYLQFCGNDQPPGIFSPSVDDGYYAKIDGLTAGKHTLHITARNPTFNFDVNVTYVLDVVRVSSR